MRTVTQSRPAVSRPGTTVTNSKACASGALTMSSRVAKHACLKTAGKGSNDGKEPDFLEGTLQSHTGDEL